MSSTYTPESLSDTIIKGFGWSTLIGIISAVLFELFGYDDGSIPDRSVGEFIVGSAVFLFCFGVVLLRGLMIYLHDKPVYDARRMDYFKRRAERGILEAEQHTRIGEPASNPIEHHNEVAPQESENIFKKDDDIWEIVFQGKKCSVVHSKGMSQIRYLLMNSGNGVSGIQIVQSIDGGDIGEQPLVLVDDGLQTDSPQIETVDEQSIKNIKERLDDLKIALNWSNDLDERKDIGTEINALEEWLGKYTNKDGDSRLIPNANERARSPITKSINRAIENIRQKHPALAEHMKKELKTGATFIYNPDPPIHWN